MSKSVKMDVNPNVIQPDSFVLTVSLPNSTSNGFVSVDLIHNESNIFNHRYEYLPGVQLDSYVQACFSYYQLRCTSNSSVSATK